MQAACLSPRVFTETDDHDHIVPDRLRERERARAHACVRVCACMHVSTQTSTHARTHARTHAYARMQACTPPRTYTHQCTHTHTIVFGFQALDAITSYSCIKQFNKSMKQFNDSIKCVARGTRRKLFLNPTIKLNPKP